VALMDGYLDLADWRRLITEIFATWRHDTDADPEGATSRFRAAKDELFRSHPQTPLKPEDRARFGGLPYFPYDPAYRMTAVVEPAAPPERPEFALAMQLPASVTPEFSFRLIGRAALSGPLAGAVLPVFWMEGYAGGLFVPFRDATSGAETYGAGRYLLDTAKSADLGPGAAPNSIVLDFNFAFHPSCAFDPKWSCPLAPPENRLDIRIEGGERLS
jgi:hypothetical protein